MPCEEILEKKMYRHDEGGLLYSVIELVPDLTGYETTRDLGKRAVYYVQLQDGEAFSAGTSYVRAEEDFKEQFSAI